MSKINITIDERLLKRADDFAKSNYTTRSGLIATALGQYLNQQDMIASIREMRFLIRKVAETKEFSEDDKKQLENFEQLCCMLIR